MAQLGSTNIFGNLSVTGTISGNAATTSVAGLMSAADKSKLNGIATGANNYTHPNSHAASMITGLATVATSGSYNDLSNKPTILTLGTSASTAAKGNHTHSNYVSSASSSGSGNAVTSVTISGNTLTYTKGSTFTTLGHTHTWETDISDRATCTINTSGTITGSAVYGAVWNDLTDSIEVPEDTDLEPGYAYCFDGEKYYKSTKYLDEGFIGIHSDTSGFNMGKKNKGKELDAAVAGFVLAYVDKVYKPGTPLTITEGGRLTEIKLEDKRDYPERIVGTFWKAETAEEWGSEVRKVKVNGRCWIKVR